MNKISLEKSNSKLHQSFRDYFNLRNGNSIEIDLSLNECFILDKDGEIRGSLKIGKSAKIAGLELTNMLNRNLTKGDFGYFVLLDGDLNRDWLFALESAI